MKTGVKLQPRTVKDYRKREANRLLLFVIPGMLLMFVFTYLPMWGWILAFTDYVPGMRWSKMEFVGLDNFTLLFQNPLIRRNLFNSMKNTLGMHFLSYATMPLNMAFAIFLSELHSKKFVKIVQTVSTLPHFISWTIMFGIVHALFSTTGVINVVLQDLGLEPINILTTDKHVWLIQVGLQTWKGIGWSAIVYFAAIAGIDQELFEAALVDGAGRMRRIWHITVPHLIPTFFVLLIMAIGNVLSTGIDQYYVFGNAMNKQYIETFDLYVYNMGIGSGLITYGTAISILKSIIAVVLFFSANALSKKVRGTGIA